MKELLVLSPWFPYPADNGSRLRIFSLMHELSKSFRVRLVSGVQSDSPEGVPDALAGLCQSVVRVPWLWHDGNQRGIGGSLRALFSPTPKSILETPNPALTAAITDQLALPTDAILVCELGMDAYLPRAVPSVPILLDGAEITGMKRTYLTAHGPKARLRAYLMHQKGASYWRRALKRYDAVTTASRDEAEALQNLVGLDGPRIIVIPNGVDVGAYPVRDPGGVQPGRLIYNGALTYQPNRDAVDFFVKDILPRVVEHAPEAHLVVTGRYDVQSVGCLNSHPLVELTGYLEDLKPTLTASAVCVVPLQSGGGTRLKILEAWGAGVPVVSTAIGAAGLEGAISGDHLLIADRPDDFADAVVTLLSSPELGDRLAKNARQLAETRYTWSASAAPLTAALLGENHNSHSTDYK